MSKLSVINDSKLIIISFRRKDIKKSTLRSIKPCLTYQDTDIDLQEHLYSTGGLTDIEKPSKQIKEIMKVCDKYQAAYFRLIIM
jgi:hypothetical protein